LLVVVAVVAAVAAAATLWSTVILEELSVTELVKKFPTFDVI